MKKLFTLITLMAMFIGMASAQTIVNPSKITDNTYIGVQVGATTPLALDNVFPLNANAAVKLGKEFTPVFGAELEGTGFFGQKRFANSHTFLKATNVGLNGTINLTNLFAGYKGEPRKFEVSTVTGLGWLNIMNDHLNTDDDELTAKTGLNLAFNLGNEKQHQLYIQPAVLWNLTGGKLDGVQFDKNHAQLGVAIGYAYKFKTSYGKHYFTNPRLYSQEEIDALNAKINELQGRQAEVREVVTEVVKEVTVEAPAVEKTYVVSFAQGSATLTDDAKATLDKVVGKVRIIASASPEGGKTFNQRLSERRADAVCEYLQARGIEVVTSQGVGVTGPDSNRIAVVTVE